MEIEQFASTGYLVFYRTYSRKRKESWKDVTKRCVCGLQRLGSLTKEEVRLITTQMENKTAMPSGRWLWVGGTNWLENPDNVYGAYNCNSTNLKDWEDFTSLMNIAMMGCGTGAKLLNLDKLPTVLNSISVGFTGEFGQVAKNSRQEITTITLSGGNYVVTIGDCRKGWIDAYGALLHLSSVHHTQKHVKVMFDISHVRGAGESLSGFGGVAEPIGLKPMLARVGEILSNVAENKQGRIDSIDACLLIDEPASAIVVGNIRRTAGMKQGKAADELFAEAKDNLWQQDSDGNWHINANRSALRMSNHTRVFLRNKPTLDECISAVRKQFYSGEGAIQWAGEAIVRALGFHQPNQDEIKKQGITAWCNGDFLNWMEKFAPQSVGVYGHAIERYGLNPCGEIIGENFFCNLAEVHLNLIDPNDIYTQEKAFKAAAISAASLLHHQFPDKKYQESRNIDPIIGVSFTGLFDFFAATFGWRWLEWWQAGRPRKWGETLAEFFAADVEIPNNAVVNESSLFSLPDTDFYSLQVSDFFLQIEQAYLSWWKGIVEAIVKNYCNRHNLKIPNRCTTVQPAGSKSLLTGASPGWHPPKALQYIRRITFAANHPVALTAIQCGYGVVPGQSELDENGKLLSDPFHPDCKEWLIEVPVRCFGYGEYYPRDCDPSQFSALAQFDFYMQVQRYYTGHNTSATIEIREEEIEVLATRIYQAIQDDEGYISVALLPRFDNYQAFPRMPFEPISDAEFMRRVSRLHDTDKFLELLTQVDSGKIQSDGPAPCDSDKCLL